LIIKTPLGFIRGVRLCLVFGQLTEKEAIKKEPQDKYLENQITILLQLLNSHHWF
jgi:hypothetical protein